MIEIMHPADLRCRCEMVCGVWAVIAVTVNTENGLQNGITPALHDTTHVWGDTPHKRHARLAPLRARRAAARARTSRYSGMVAIAADARHARTNGAHGHGRSARAFG